MANANTRYAMARPTTTFEWIQRARFCAPPSAHQAPNTNSNCQANGLKTQVPLGYAGMFHSNSHISAYSVADASSAIDGAFGHNGISRAMRTQRGEVRYP